jgi:hypothetical protein
MKKAIKGSIRIVWIELGILATLIIVAGMHIGAVIGWWRTTSRHNRQTVVAWTVFLAIPVILTVTLSARMCQRMEEIATEDNLRQAPIQECLNDVYGDDKMTFDTDENMTVTRTCLGKEIVKKVVTKAEFVKAGIDYEKEEALKSKGIIFQSEFLPRSPIKLGAPFQTQRLISIFWVLREGSRRDIETIEVESGWNPNQIEIIAKKDRHGKTVLVAEGHGTGPCQADTRWWWDGSILPGGEILDWDKYVNDPIYQLRVCNNMMEGGVKMYGSAKEKTDRVEDHFIFFTKK